MQLCVCSHACTINNGLVCIVNCFLKLFQIIKKNKTQKKPYTKMAQEQEENITKQELLITQIIKINVLKDTLPH